MTNWLPNCVSFCFSCVCNYRTFLGVSYSQVSEWVKVDHSCLTLCNPMDYTVHGILQFRILEWVSFPSPGYLPNPGIEPRSSTLLADSLPSQPQGNKSFICLVTCHFGFLFWGRIFLILLFQFLLCEILYIFCIQALCFF